MPGRKRKAAAVQPSNTKDPYSRGGATAARQRTRAEESVTTLYGNLFGRMELPSNDGGGPVTVHFCNPFALLWHICVTSTHFFFFLKACGVHRIVMYMDETVPGNNLRPDLGRKYIAVYWTFLEFPDWFRVRSLGWIPFCFLPAKSLKRLKGALPMLARAVLRTFWPECLPGEKLNFRHGVRLACGHAPDSDAFHLTVENLQLRAEFACFLADEAAIKALCACKGASGLKCCICCKNVIGIPMRATEVTPPHVHFTNWDMGSCVPHTPQSLLDGYVWLHHQAELCTQGMLTKGQFEEFQKRAGLNYTGGESILAPDIAGLAQIPYSVFWDWMHCAVASGGVAQYELNQILLRIAKLFDLKAVEQFATNIVFPRAQKAKLCFSERLKTKPTDHIRAFASEVLNWVVVVGLFADLVLLREDGQPLKAEVECFNLLGRIIFLLRLGDGCVPKVALLRELLHEHHVRFMALYAEAATPKLHFLRHIPDCIDRYKVLMSCFAAERMHRKSKAVAAFAFKSWCATMIRRNITTYLQSTTTPAVFQMCHLVPPEGKQVPAKHAKALRAAGLLEGAVLPRMSTVATCVAGEVRRLDLLVFTTSTGFIAGWAQYFYQVRSECWAYVIFLQPLGQMRFSKATGRTTAKFARLAHSRGAFPYYMHVDTVHVVASPDAFAD